MNEYQIRILARDGECTTYSCHCTSAFAAVRRARSIASAGDIVEVWSGMECVFNDHTQIAASDIKAGSNEPT